MRKCISIITVFFYLFIFSDIAAIAQVFYVDTDNTGPPVAMWNEKAEKVWEGEYYPFGQEYRSQNIKTSNKNRFIGKERDKETGLTYFGARYFDERSGRFLTPDPVRVVDPFTSKTNHQILANPQRLNRYTYGLNNPYRYIDPDGNVPLDTIWDAANVIYDIATGDKVSLSADLAAMAVPYLPAGVTKIGKAAKIVDKMGDAPKRGVSKTIGRSGKQARLKQLADDLNVSSADRGWIKQEMNQIQRGTRKNVCVPPGKNLAHHRGFKAKKGYGYEHSDLQDIDLHKLQHKHEGY